jgi:NAD-dependent SIR2 family protein deacetylase
MPKTKYSGSFKTFTCPKCNALYQMIRVEEGPENTEREVTCHSCGAPLSGREGQFALKYFLLWPTERKMRRPAT